MVARREDEARRPGVGGREADQADYPPGVSPADSDYLKPQLGHIALAKITAEDISAAYDAIQAERGPALGPASLRRVHACLSSALTRAVKSRRISYNPAVYVDLPDAPAPVTHPMEPEELRRFLDSIQTHRLGTAFETIASCGLRRGEGLGLRWLDVDVERGIITVRQEFLHIGTGAVFGPPKTKAGVDRVIELDVRTVGVLLAQRLAQDVEREQWADAYEDFDLVFAQENGRPYDPSAVSKKFVRLAAEAGAPRTRLHDLRHGSASLMLMADVPLPIVSKRLGHSNINITHTLYSLMLKGIGRSAAEAASALVPRASDRNVTGSATPANRPRSKTGSD